MTACDLRVALTPLMNAPAYTNPPNSGLTHLGVSAMMKSWAITE